ncbi:hypothetical protein DM860_017391 [Cuscuta australis]|uniref:cytokinin riboside 5'-monophosphate phosphoribohydrolase n=1 Tax=Cuscuta australis TaxID=267555 RepID=A0A328DV14_9ASTE|nr:hypothetical protein DM860_017391 [Cuscuta australis]
MEGTSRTLPYTIRFVGLLGSHSLGRNPKFMATAVDLGRELIRRKIKLAYGGGSVGLQGAVASTVFTNGGLVRGFIPGYIATRGVYGPTYGVEHTVSSNYYKYFEMNHAVEAFIILPGGVDTMEGLFTLISWASEGLHNRPIGLLNIDGYFNNLIKFLDDAVRQNFMASSQRKLFISSFFVGELLDKLEFAKAFPAFGANYDEFANPGGLDLELHLPKLSSGTYLLTVPLPVPSRLGGPVLMLGGSRDDGRGYLLRLTHGTPSGIRRIGGGLAATRTAVRSENHQSSSRTYEDKSQLRCTYCGGTKHTAEGCFKRIGYPEWWPDNQKRGKMPTGVAGAVVGSPKITNITASQAPYFFTGIAMKRGRRRETDEEGEGGVEEGTEKKESAGFLPLGVIPTPRIPIPYNKAVVKAKTIGLRLTTHPAMGRTSHRWVSSPLAKPTSRTMPNSDGKLYPSLFKPWSNIITRQNALTQRWEALPIDGNPTMEDQSLRLPRRKAPPNPRALRLNRSPTWTDRFLSSGRRRNSTGSSRTLPSVEPRVLPELNPQQKGYHDLDNQLQASGLWSFVSRSRSRFNPAFVRAFYSNLRRDGDTIRSSINLYDIEIDLATFAWVAGLPTRGDDITTYGGDDMILNNEAVVI